MTNISNLIVSVEKILDEAFSLNKSRKNYNSKLNELDEVIKEINQSLSTKSQSIQFTEIDKEKIKNIFSLINKLENTNNSNLDFFEALSKHLSDKIDSKTKYS